MITVHFSKKTSHSFQLFVKKNFFISLKLDYFLYQSIFTKFRVKSENTIILKIYWNSYQMFDRIPDVPSNNLYIN